MDSGHKIKLNYKLFKRLCDNIMTCHMNFLK
jgi:hypothetical protein